MVRYTSAQCAWWLDASIDGWLKPRSSDLESHESPTDRINYAWRRQMKLSDVFMLWRMADLWGYDWRQGWPEMKGFWYRYGCSKRWAAMKASLRLRSSGPELDLIADTMKHGSWDIHEMRSRDQAKISMMVQQQSIQSKLILIHPQHSTSGSKVQESVNSFLAKRLI